MEQNITNPSLNNDKSAEQQNIPYIPEINNIPPIPNIENSANPSDTNQGINQQASQNSQTKGFDSTHLEYSKQQQQYANQNLGYANNNYNDPNNSSQQQNFGNYPPNNILLNIPNSGGILTLGILSIVSLCCCGGLIAPILSIIALAMIPKAKKMYFQNPQSYKSSSLNNIKAGQICAIIGLAIAVIFWIYLMFIMIFEGVTYNEVNEAINEAWNQTGY
ncbi:MAG TPA: CCC motif membrane protein [Bacteroidales bacterium]|nr:CCC motif membrane protein [Bacteroidales bacterium]